MKLQQGRVFKRGGTRELKTVAMSKVPSQMWRGCHKIIDKPNLKRYYDMFLCIQSVYYIFGFVSDTCIFWPTQKGFDFLKSGPRVALAAVGKRRKMVEKGKLNEPETNQQSPERLLSSLRQDSRKADTKAYQWLYQTQNYQNIDR